MSLSLYAIAAMRRDHPLSSEAAIKYFVLGALASGFLLYGMSMLYGGTGTLDLARIARALGGGAPANTTVMVFGVVFVVAGLAFKFGAVPFHMWVPDVYQGTPTAATLLIAAAPKLATFAIAFRLLADGLIAVAADWQQMLLVLSVLSMAVGNLVAIAQTNLKRMLAYSTIAQVGFVLIGMVAGVVRGDASGAPDAWSASMFYIVTYVLTTLGTFGVVLLVARRDHEAEEIADLRGLARRSPWLAFVMLILMFSLAGIPPTVGFYAKLAVLQAALAAGLLWLAVLAVLLSLVGAFYYLRVVKVMYFEEPIDATPIEAAADARAVIAINGALVLVLGLVPGPLMALCLKAVQQAFGGCAARPGRARCRRRTRRTCTKTPSTANSSGRARSCACARTARAFPTARCTVASGSCTRGRPRCSRSATTGACWSSGSSATRCSACTSRSRPARSTRGRPRCRPRGASCSKRPATRRASGRS
jgi:NADH-quinone oxidoreductase subunit N